MYAYQPVAPLGGEVHYWYYRTVETPDSTVLVSTRYDEALEPRQLVRERIVSQGESPARPCVFFSRLPPERAPRHRPPSLQPALFSFETPDPDRVLVSAVERSAIRLLR